MSDILIHNIHPYNFRFCHFNLFNIINILFLDSFSKIYLSNGIYIGHDKSFSNVVARWATIEPFLVARSKRSLPRICYR